MTSEKRTHKRELIMSCVIFLVLFGLFAYGVLIEPGMLVVREQEVKVPHWAIGLNHLRVVVLSDLHVGSLHINVEKLHRIVEEVNQQQPDIVFLLGDYVTGHGGKTSLKPEAFVKELAGLKSQFGVYSVLGNHDWWYNGEDVRRELEKANIHVLENNAEPVLIKGATLWVAGLADSWTRSADIKAALGKIPATQSSVLLMHNPDSFVDVPASVSLSLAGHTHGGQVALPFVGALVVPTKLGSRYARGFIEEGGKHYFITSGIGTSIFPIRFGVPPEICVLDLIAK
jgi:uncharacterized protein